MCGPSSQETGISDKQSDFYNTLSNAYGSSFAPYQSILGQMTKSFTPLLQAGPGARGFSPGQRTDLMSDATEATGAEYAKATAATQGALAARGGGNAFLPSGSDAEITAQTTRDAAAQQAGAVRGVDEADYDRGYGNWQTAANFLSGTAQQYNPNAFAGSATTAGNSAFGSASQISQEEMSPYTALIGGLSSVAGAAAGGYTSGLARSH